MPIIRGQKPLSIKVSSYELPLFPLNTVLFPGMPLPLHIFEPRYKMMINECAREQKPFGVVLIKSGAEVGAPAEPHDIGTTARITSVQRIAEGRMNIETIGQDRFRILDSIHDKPYPSAIVENYPMNDNDSINAGLAANRLRPLVTRYMTLLAKAASTTFDKQRLPNDPLALAYLAAIVVQVPFTVKQNLLCMPSTTLLLQEENTLYRSETALLNAMLTRTPADDTSPFSPN
jgi:Lon protease-like protein